MGKFDFINNPTKLLKPEIVQMIGSIRENKGKQELFLEANIDDLKTLLEVAYLTQNGQGEYEYLTTAEIDKLDRYRAAYTFITKLKKAEERADKEGWISADDVEKELGVSD